jgi:uncharacterized membrane protein
MKRFPLSLCVLAVGVLVGVGQVILLGPLLPERVASHFNAAGEADGWMTRDAFLKFNLGMTFFVATVFALTPRFIARTPTEMINLPNKEYWLAPERRAASLAYIGDRMYAFGAGTMALLTSVMQLVYEANIRGTYHLGSTIWVYLALYMIYTGVWLAGLFRRFSLPQA